MKVAIIIPRIDQLGPVKVIQTLVNSLSENDKIQIKVFYIDQLVDSQVKLMVPVEKLDQKTFDFNEFDIIHTNGIRPDLFAFLNRKKIKFHISTIHNFVFEDLLFSYNKIISFIFGNLWLLIWRGADKLVCLSPAMKNYYGRWFSRSKLEVIFNGIDEHDYPIIPDNEIMDKIAGFRSIGLKVIGSIGILTRRKGFDQILNLISINKELALIIIGKGKELGNLKALATKLGIHDRCFFCGFRSNAANYIKHFDFFIMPSRSEGFGLALIEDVQQKVPVICSDIAVFRELFTIEEVTFFELENISSLAEALEEACETGSSKVIPAFNRYQNNYTGKLMADNYLRLYHSCC
jgi:glycosyltransferase involved in cell wall biosynthesis